MSYINTGRSYKTKIVGENPPPPQSIMKNKQANPKIRLIGNRILIKEIEVKEKGSAIFIPDAAKEKPNIGQVVAVGPGGYNKAGILVNTTVKVNDTVLFNVFGGAEVEIDNEKLVLMTEDNIIGILGQYENKF